MVECILTGNYCTFEIILNTDIRLKKARNRSRFQIADIHISCAITVRKCTYCKICTYITFV